MQIIELETVRDRARRTQDGMLTTAHRLWLAGLGAVAVAGEEGQELFTRLVDRGRTLEARGRERGREQVDRLVREADRTRAKVGERVDRLGGLLEGRVGRALHRVGLPTQEEIRALGQRVGDLAGRVASRAGVPTAAAAPDEIRVRWSGERWTVEAAGVAGPASVHGTKREALTAARAMAQEAAPSALVVHRMDGSVQSRAAYGPPAA